MYFSNSPHSLGIHNGDKVDILFSIGVNEWQDRKNVQLIIKDIKVAISGENQYKNNRQRFEDIKSGATFVDKENIFPERSDFLAVYKVIQNSLHAGIDVLTHKDIMAKTALLGDNTEIGYIKLKFIIMVFKEMNLLYIDEFSDEKYRFKLHYSTTKKDLSKSSILRRLRSQIR